MKKTFPSILDKDFKYVPSGKTNIRKTFDRIKKEQKETATIQNATQTQPINIFITRKIAKG